MEPHGDFWKYGIIGRIIRFCYCVHVCTSIRKYSAMHFNEHELFCFVILIKLKFPFRLLGFNRGPFVVGRRINFRDEILPVAGQTLRQHANVSGET